ncbi:MAG: hypothetical protein US13_C0001G0093 [candidate division TM6 bacterium GW2011_GWE2_36_25]|nr:MAG: hypothetical protein US03_C0001G0111 [candidate division TM6 bacterium GW2011_GWF2_36_131]KKQ03753.1 MAG: hypothetical protein US13_C0001G0093 [candidate division TM6 bacterium GW2011_GWE2_36_25]KKQ19898.1 MAG: hypothetical protein US32_C0003G0015 [candidate division TM6 bacterium GW2011_GWA2_36_9]
MQHYHQDLFEKNQRELKKEKEACCEACEVAVCCAGTVLQFLIMYLCIKNQKEHKSS